MPVGEQERRAFPCAGNGHGRLLVEHLKAAQLHHEVHRRMMMLAERVERGFDRLVRAYDRSVRALFPRRLLVMLAYVVLVLATVALFASVT